MKITCVEKLHKAFEFARGKDAKRMAKIREIFQKMANDNQGESERLETLDELDKLITQPSMEQSLNNCLERILQFEVNGKKSGMDIEYTISPDWGAHTFYFSSEYADGKAGLCGGIVYHGCPEDGYISNNAIQISQSYGWCLHT